MRKNIFEFLISVSLLRNAILSLAVGVLMGCSSSASDGGSALAVSGGGITVDVVATNAWQGGFNGAVRVSNVSFTTPITSFEVAFAMGGAVTGSAWNGTISGSNPYTAINPSFLQYSPITSGKSWDVGFSGSGSIGSVSISSVKINGASIAMGSGGGTSGDTTAPTISLTTSATSVSSATSITLTANATDTVGVTKVEFYDGTTLIGTDTSSPYSQSVSFAQTTTAQTGTKTYIAKAFDAAGNSATSSGLSVALNIPANAITVGAPSVSLSASSTNVTMAGSITLTAAATAGNNATVSKVEFLDGSNVISTDTSSPYTATVSFSQNSTAQSGTKIYMARVTNSGNLTAASPTVSVSYNIPATGGGSTTQFILGADISSVQENNFTFKDTDGQTKTVFNLFKNHGFNYIRLKTFVNPKAAYGYASTTNGCPGLSEAFGDKAHVIAFGKQVKAAGMGFLLDFHYSDTWADPGKQIIPEAWRGAKSITEMAALLKAYTKDVLSAAIAAGARPDMVQVGNETTPGMLANIPGSSTDCYGNNSVSAPLGGSSSNWNNLGILLKAGVEAVREVDSSIKVVLHIENTKDAAGVKSWVSNALAQGVKFDVLGLSAYVAYQGQPSVWENTFTQLASAYPNLKFIIAEYNPERTKANLIMKNLPNGQGLGTFIWEPTRSGAWGNSLFSSQGNVLTANTGDFAEYDALLPQLGLR